MEKEVIVQIYRRIYSIEKENNFESVYKYQDIITGIEVTLENGNKVFKDNNNNIFPCLNNETLVHPSNGYAFPIYVDDKSNSDKKGLIKELTRNMRKYKFNFDIRLINSGRNMSTVTQINNLAYEINVEQYSSFNKIISKIKGEDNMDEVVKEEPKKEIYSNELYDEVIKVVKCQDEQVRKITTAIAQNQRINNPNMKTTLFVCGPTGSGKTEIFRQIRACSDIPVVMEDATEYSITSFQGKDVTEMLAHLYIESDRNIEKAQQGIIIVDEIDKKTSSNNQHYTYAKGVMDSFLKMAEGHVYELDKRMTGIGVPISFDTSKVTFAFLGACDGIERLSSNNKSMGFNGNIYQNTNSNQIYTKESLYKYGFGQEFLRRCTLCPLKKLEEKDLIEILNTSDSSILKLYKDFYQSLGINFIYDTKTIEAIAKKASINSLGASELKVILEDALEIANFYINSSQKYKELIITSDTINNPNKYILRK